MSDTHPTDPIISDLSANADLIDIIEEFVDALPDRLTALASALESENFDELKHLAHQLKGAAGGYGFPAITRSASELESKIVFSSESMSLDKIKREFESLRELCRRARAK